MIEVTIIPDSIQLIKMTDAEYFSDKYRDYISNSRLGLINPDQDGSPDKYETKIKETYSESFEFGSAIHAMVLQPESFYIANINKPTGKLGLFAEEVYQLRQKGLTIKEATTQASQNVDYYASKFSPARLKTAIKGSLSFYLQRIKFQEELDKQLIFLSAPMQEKFDKCMVNIAESDKISTLLRPQALFSEVECFNEYAILCEAEVLLEGKTKIVKLKAKLDNFTINHETSTLTLNDLKTTGKPIAYFMGNYVKSTSPEGDALEIWYDGSFQKYHYYRQLGMYLWMLQCAVQKIYGLIYKSKVNLLVIESIPDFKSKVYAVNGKYINAGINEFKKLLTLALQWEENKQIQSQN